MFSPALYSVLIPRAMALENDGGASQIQVPVASALPWLLLVRSWCHIWRGISCNRVVEASGLLFGRSQVPYNIQLSLQ